MADPIKHVVVLMMENRSFDHFIGALPGMDGARPEQFNYERPGSNVSYPQKPDAVRKLKPDPKHETPNVLRQIDGDGLGPMGGFVYDFAISHPNAPKAWQQVMSYFADGELPALHALAKNFCVCDPWFSSVPGPTWTNRFFAHSGTAQGWVSMPEPPFHLNLHAYDQDTIYDRLIEKNLSWRIYAGDIPQSLLLQNQRRRENRKGYSRMSTFFKDVPESDGASFPAFVFIEPRYMMFGQNDQHPPHDVLKGDELIAQVYNTLRANEALWDSTLLIVVWDEHGGFYDHVSPPAAMPPDHKAEEGFAFDRYGVRVPALLISKWVTPASVFRPSTGVLDHTSILRYLIDKHGLGPLGNRTATAASIADALTDTPNDAAPVAVGGAPRPLAMTMEGEDLPGRMNENQAALIEFSKRLEIESGADPHTIGTHVLRAGSGLKGEMDVAVDRVWKFIGDGGGQ